MKFVSKTWNILVKSGLILFIWLVMFIGAISLFSLSQKGKVHYGNRCVSSLNESAIDYLNQEEIIAYDYEFNCNTLYLDLNVLDNLNKEQITALLVKIATYYKDINFNTNTQVTIKNANYLILASIIEGGTVSLSVSQL